VRFPNRITVADRHALQFWAEVARERSEVAQGAPKFEAARAFRIEKHGEQGLRGAGVRNHLLREK